MKSSYVKNLSIVSLLLLFGRFAFAGEAEKYFPLHVGDRWTYYHELYIHEELASIDSITVIVSDAKEINGNTYYLLQGPEAFESGYYRTEGNNVYQNNESFKIDTTSYDLALRGEGSGEWRVDEYLGEYYIMNIDTDCSSTRFSEKMDLPLGLFDGYLCKFCALDSGWIRHVFLIPTIGIAYIRIGEGIDVAGGIQNYYYLQSAVIDGKDIIVFVDSKPEKMQLSIISYPNPFNSSATISITLNEPDFTSITIYNMVGQKVRTIFEDHLTTGKHYFHWNGLNDNAELIPSGVYLINSTFRLKRK